MIAGLALLFSRLVKRIGIANFLRPLFLGFTQSFRIFRHVFVHNRWKGNIFEVFGFSVAIFVLFVKLMQHMVWCITNIYKAYLLGKWIGPKIWNCKFRLKFNTLINSITFSVFDRSNLFWANLVQKIKITTTVDIILWDFLYFTKFSSHNKWNEAWLLVMNIVYTRYPTISRTTKDLRSEDFRRFFQWFDFNYMEESK